MQPLTIRLATLLLLILLSLMNKAHAEGGCPPGQYPQQGQGWKTCVPMPSSGDGQTQAQPMVTWYPRSGAVATDLPKGILGVAENERNQSEAKKLAVADCQAKGGTDCKVKNSYTNGCVAMTVGTNGLVVIGAERKEVAIKQSMASCQADGDKTCYVYYTGCSTPDLKPYGK